MFFSNFLKRVNVVMTEKAQEHKQIPFFYLEENEACGKLTSALSLCPGHGPLGLCRPSTFCGSWPADTSQNE